ncbi:hypothetical protein IO99_06465 [Clostridium sulfidigenes]|uniref:Uncharacterized protein n=2 Tax=Clostridium sulfidigenes TaxID=318464 RepID=A0A084JE37_9CLOT|nr:hypothetical protein IO99_06465 [Clostridium sulfidigenes]
MEVVMNIFKNLKAKLFIRIGVILLCLIEISILVMVFFKYDTVISYGFFTILIPFQVLWWFNLTGNNTKVQITNRQKISTIIISISSILIAMSIPAALPKYTYVEGKTILEESLNKDDSMKFLVESDNVYTIDVTPFHKPFPKSLFINNKFYYYEIIINDNLRYFAINPLTGERIELADSFYH